MSMSPGKFRGMRRMADSDGYFRMLAVDQRPPIKNVVKERRGEALPRREDIRAVKRLLMECLAPHASAVLADPTHALSDALTILAPETGLIVTMEDSLFTEEPGGRVSSEIPDWDVGKIRRIGGDAVKVLTWFRPDQSAATIEKQKDFSKRIGDACAKYDLPYLFELLVYPLESDSIQTTDYVEQPGKRVDHVIDSVRLFADPAYGIDVFKLESPLPGKDVPDPVTGDPTLIEECRQAYQALATEAGRPWVMLSAGVSQEAFRNVLHFALEAGASGFLAGRAIWWDAFQHFPDMGAMRKDMSEHAAAYMASLSEMARQRGQVWHAHPCFGPEGARPAGFDSLDFPEKYRGL